MVDESKLSNFPFTTAKTVKMTVSDDHNQVLSRLFNPEFMKSDLHKRKLPPSFFKQPSEDRRASINPEGLKLRNEASIFHNKSNSSPACINPEFYDKANLVNSDTLDMEPKHSTIQPNPTPTHMKSDPHDINEQRMMSVGLNKKIFEICPLGPSYDMDLNSAGQVYFLNHDSQETSWFDPRIPVEYQRWGMTLLDLEDAHKAFANALQSKSCDDILKNNSSPLKPIQQMQFHGRSMSQPASCTNGPHPCAPGPNVPIPTCTSHPFSSCLETSAVPGGHLASGGSTLSSPVGCFPSTAAVPLYKMSTTVLRQQQPPPPCLMMFENSGNRTHPPAVYTRSNTVPGILASPSHNVSSTALRHKDSHLHYPQHHHPHHFHHPSAPAPSPSTSTRGLVQRSRVMPLGGYPPSQSNIATVAPQASQKPQHVLSISSSATPSTNQSLPPLPNVALGGGGGGGAAGLPYPAYSLNLVSPPCHSHQSSLDSGRGSGKCSSHYGVPDFLMNKLAAPAGGNNLVGLAKVGGSGSMSQLNVSKTASQQTSLSSGLNVLQAGGQEMLMVEPQYTTLSHGCDLMNTNNMDTAVPMDYSLSMDELPDLSELDFELNMFSPSGEMHVQ